MSDVSPISSAQEPVGFLSHPITNAAAYRFAQLTDLPQLRQKLLARSRDLSLRGTVLLSTEGINLFVAGTAGDVATFLDEIRRVPGLSELTAKLSLSVAQPFQRMLVKIKKEIIAFGIEGIDPVNRPAPRVSPQQLKEWLDHGKDLILLDTRNDYEVRLGTFRNAKVFDLDQFRNFPQKVAELPAEWKDKLVVSFCTGGIRCEKAAPYLQTQGYSQVFQLDGGILKYFEECGNAHYDGDCFVFDERIGVDPELSPATAGLCETCRAPIVMAGAESEPEKVCQRCYEQNLQFSQKRLLERSARLTQMVNPLPGQGPYDNFRPIKILAASDGKTLGEALATMFDHLPATHWQNAFAQGLITRSNHELVNSGSIVRAGERYLHCHPNTCEPPVNSDVEFLLEDQLLIAVNKPAPLPMHPCGRFHRNTLGHFLNLVYEPERPRPTHRLDSNTTGICLFAKTKPAAAYVQKQFEAGTVQKRYLARVQGHPTADTFFCDESLSEVAGVIGSRTVEVGGQTARTEFAVRERCADGTSLVEVIPLTGRTNQIRVHLWWLGFPIVGDQAYLPDRRHGDTQTGHPDDAPLCLHAWQLTLLHPGNQKPLHLTAPPPSWAVST